MISLARTSLAVVPALVLGLVAAAASMASERVEHYEGESAATLEEAVADFTAYNEKLAAILEQESFEGTDLEAIHELTYTLENALERMREDMAGLAETLEALHLASEDHDQAAVREQGVAYLATARTLLR